LLTPRLAPPPVGGRAVGGGGGAARGGGGRRRAAGQNLTPYEGDAPPPPRGAPLPPGGGFSPADGSIGRALQHGDAIEVVGGDRYQGILRAEPPLAHEEAGHALPLGQMFRVVPVVKLVLGHPRDAHCRDQRALGHRRLLSGLPTASAPCRSSSAGRAERPGPSSCPS